MGVMPPYIACLVRCNGYTITPRLRAYYIIDLFWRFVRCFPIPHRIAYSLITLIARNRHYAPSAPITHSASFPFFSSVFCPRPQRSDSSTLPCTVGCFSFVSRHSSSSLRIDFICQMALRGVWQLKKLIVSYCDWGGSSRGIGRSLLTTMLP
ncbi:uncharacterized protein [Gossypium hirsutum]|uniref:Uncharacterized protein n=1 Tax=Gossypium hirsutum TaxID=3635 RepID=A0ABM3AD02_GOSHI|nr:uncharacterized protein LOC107953465 [Gossypium hirsutum]